MSSLRLLFAVLVVVCAMHAAAAVQCQQCSYLKYPGGTEVGKDCKDPYIGDNEKSCGGDFCFKSVEKSDGMEAVTRGCGALVCTEEGSKDIASGKRYCCMGDNCNSATAAIPGLTVLLASSLLFWLV